MAARANLAAFQTSAGEDEGPLGAKGLDSAHICGRRGRRRGRERKEAGARPPTRRSEIAAGAPDTLLQSVCGGYFFHSPMLFPDMGKED